MAMDYIDDVVHFFCVPDMRVIAALISLSIDGD